MGGFQEVGDTETMTEQNRRYVQKEIGRLLSEIWRVKGLAEQEYGPQHPHHQEALRDAWIGTGATAGEDGEAMYLNSYVSSDHDRPAKNILGEWARNQMDHTINGMNKP